MAGSINKVIDDARIAYQCGMSIPEVSRRFGIARSTLRYHLKKFDVLRGRAEGVRIAAEAGRLGSGMRGKRRKFTPEHCKNISAGRTLWADRGGAAGVSLKPNGYLEFTRGLNKGRLVHVVKMEERLGRRLRKDECVHHIDGEKTNNEDNNLALLTRSGHARLHRREQRIAKEKHNA